MNVIHFMYIMLTAVPLQGQLTVFPKILQSRFIFYIRSKRPMMNFSLLSLGHCIDDEVLVSTRMWFWSRIKKVCCSSFLKMSLEILFFLVPRSRKKNISRDENDFMVTFRGIPPISHQGIVCLYVYAFQYMLWCLDCMNINSRPRFVLLSCLCLSGSLSLKIDPCVNSQECWKFTEMKDESWPNSLTAF
jgi:hypothetical protein